MKQQSVHLDEHETAQAAKEPLRIFVQHRVTVLIRRPWVQQQAASQLRRIAQVVMPALAQQALYQHVAANVRRYTQLDTPALAFHPMLPLLQDVEITDLVSELSHLITTATTVRANLPWLPPDLFWPMEGAFFSAIDAGPVIAPATWSRLNGDSSPYALVELWATASHGVGPFDSYLAMQEEDGWCLCGQCWRVYQMGEHTCYEGAVRCPYWCGAEIPSRRLLWQEVREQFSWLPIAPRKWVCYRR